jgi:hypothetical protein
MAVNLIVGTNSYLSTADADTYFNIRLFADTWNNASVDQKAQALIMATKRIDRLKFRGRKALLSQSLQFPRTFYSAALSDAEYAYGYPSDGWSVEKEITQCVKDACCEEAMSLLKGISQRLELQHQGVTEFTIGDLSESYKNLGTRLQSRDAHELLRPYLIGGVSIT